jgi:hypothetical protein
VRRARPSVDTRDDLERDDSDTIAQVIRSSLDKS